MNEKGLEDLLRSMPLKKPTRLPSTLSMPVIGVRRLGATALTAVCFRVPLWASAAAVVLAVVVSMQLKGRPREMAAKPARSAQARHRQRPERNAVRLREEILAEAPRFASEQLSRRTPDDLALERLAVLASRRPVSTEDFWTLPERYQRMITAARQEGRYKRVFRDRGGRDADTPLRLEGRGVR